MKKNDFILISIILIIFIPLVIIFLNLPKGGKVLVKSEGTIIDTLYLNVDGTYRYENKYGYNIVEIKNGEVRVNEADCPNKDCVNKGYVKRNNETIVCLPHKFEITVVSDKEEYDVYVR